MNCREAIALLGESQDGELGSRMGWRLRLHLWCCRHCRNYRASYQTTVRLERIAFQDPSKPEPTVPENLVAEILASARDGSRVGSSPETNGIE